MANTRPIAVFIAALSAGTAHAQPVPFAQFFPEPCPTCSCDLTLINSSLAPLLTTSAATWLPLGPTWKGSKPRVPVYVSTNLQGNIPHDGTFEEGIARIKSAIEQWNTAFTPTSPGTNLSEFEFFYAGTTPVSALADDGINVITFVDNQCPFGGGCSAYCQYYFTTNIARGFDVALYARRGTTNSTVNWSVKASPVAGDSDVWTVILHELGHGLGLAHSNFSSVVMGTNCGPGCSRRYLYSDDINGIIGLYGTGASDGLTPSLSSAIPGQSFTLTLDYPGAANRRYELRYSTDAAGGFGPPGAGPLNPAPQGFPFREWLCQQGAHLRPCDDGDSRIFPLANLGAKAWLEPDVFTAASGTLNAQGQATVTITLPANALTRFGPNLYLAAMTRGDTSTAEITSPTQVLDVSIGVKIPITAPCYANCDGSTGAPKLTPNDFQCFLNTFAASNPAANCDNSTGTPLLTANDFQCFLNAYAAGCP